MTSKEFIRNSTILRNDTNTHDENTDWINQIKRNLSSKYIGLSTAAYTIQTSPKANNPNIIYS